MASHRPACASFLFILVLTAVALGKENGITAESPDAEVLVTAFPRVDKLIEWIKASNITLNGVDLMRSESELAKKIYLSGVRGVVATRDIHRGEAVVRVPQSLVLTNEAAFSDPALGPILQSYSSSIDALDIDSRAPLAILLLWIKNNPNSEAGMRWGPYIAALPTAVEFNTPLFWSRSERAELAGTWTFDRTIADLEGMTKEYIDIFTNGLFVDHPDKFTPEQYPLADYIWAWATQWAYAVDFEESQLRPVTAEELSASEEDDDDDDDDDDEDLAGYTIEKYWKRYLIPVLDYFNHPLVDKSAALQGTSAREAHKLPYNTWIERVDNAFILRVNNSYLAGEEVFRPLVPNAEIVPNIDLLRKHGFIDPSNPLQVTALKLALDKGDQDFAIKDAWTRAYGLSQHPYPYSNYYVGSRGVPQSVTAFFRISNFNAMTDEQRQNPQMLPDPLTVIDQKNEQAMWDNLKLAIDLRLRKLKHSQEHDEALLNDASLSTRKQLAVEIRLEERMALMNAQNQLQMRRVHIGNDPNESITTTGVHKFQQARVIPTVRSINRGRPPPVPAVVNENDDEGADE